MQNNHNRNPDPPIWAQALMLIATLAVGYLFFVFLLSLN